MQMLVLLCCLYNFKAAIINIEVLVWDLKNYLCGKEIARGDKATDNLSVNSSVPISFKDAFFLLLLF